jgi:putative transposase
MSRPLRIEFRGAIYHITSRGNAKQDIFVDDANRHKFIDVLSKACIRHNWRCHAYCLMANHYHLIVETPDANISKGVAYLNGVYSQYFNRRFNRVGHLFQGRFKGNLVDRQSYLLELSRYVLLNPVRAKIVATAAAWPWSSYHQMLLPKKDSWLFGDWLLSQFGKNRAEACRRFIVYLAAGKNHPSPLLELKQQLYLGSDDFIEFARTHISDNLDDIPRAQSRAPALSIEAYEAKSTNRNEAIRSAYRSGDYSMKVIGDYFGLHYTTVSRVINR